MEELVRLPQALNRDELDEVATFHALLVAFLYTARRMSWREPLISDQKKKHSDSRVPKESRQWDGG